MSPLSSTPLLEVFSTPLSHRPWGPLATTLHRLASSIIRRVYRSRTKSPATGLASANCTVGNYRDMQGLRMLSLSNVPLGIPSDGFVVTVPTICPYGKMTPYTSTMPLTGFPFLPPHKTVTHLLQSPTFSRSPIPSYLSPLRYHATRNYHACSSHVTTSLSTAGLHHYSSRPIHRPLPTKCHHHLS